MWLALPLKAETCFISVAHCFIMICFEFKSGCLIQIAHSINLGVTEGGKMRPQLLKSRFEFSHLHAKVLKELALSTRIFYFSQKASVAIHIFTLIRVERTRANIGAFVMCCVRPTRVVKCARSAVVIDSIKACFRVVSFLFLTRACKAVTFANESQGWCD